MSGTIAALPPDRAQTEIEHRFALLGISFQYTPSQHLRLYAAFRKPTAPLCSERSSRPIFWKRWTTTCAIHAVYNAELGVQGDWFEQG